MSASDLRRIYIVSDATADTAERMLRATLVQFRGVEVVQRVFDMVRTEPELDEVLELARTMDALVVYTLVQAERRAHLEAKARDLGVTCVDLIGTLMSQLSGHLERAPAQQPGRPRLSDEYFRRIEAVEFAVKHDDGQALQGLELADIILVGISRTSKTPLSTYLAQRGWKVANVPLVLGLPMPKMLSDVDQERVFGLTIDVASLMRIRRARLKQLNLDPNGDYARRDHIIREQDYARSVFRDHPEWPVIDVSQKAIEETASVILRTIEKRARDLAATQVEG